MSADYRELEVWQLAMRLAEAAYVFTERFNDPRYHDLANQLRHAAVRVPSEIADAHAHGGERRRVRHLARALSRLAELDTLLELADRLGVVESRHCAQASSLCQALGTELRELHDQLQRQAALPEFSDPRPFGGRRTH